MTGQNYNTLYASTKTRTNSVSESCFSLSMCHDQSYFDQKYVFFEKKNTYLDAQTAKQTVFIFMLLVKKHKTFLLFCFFPQTFAMACSDNVSLLLRQLLWKESGRTEHVYLEKQSNWANMWQWLQFMSCEFCIKLLYHSFLWKFVVKLYRVKHVTVNVCTTLEVVV